MTYISHPHDNNSTILGEQQQGIDGYQLTKTLERTAQARQVAVYLLWKGSTKWCNFCQVPIPNSGLVLIRPTIQHTSHALIPTSTHHPIQVAHETLSSKALSCPLPPVILVRYHMIFLLARPHHVIFLIDMYARP